MYTCDDRHRALGRMHSGHRQNGASVDLQPGAAITAAVTVDPGTLRREAKAEVAGTRVTDGDILRQKVSHGGSVPPRPAGGAAPRALVMQGTSKRSGAALELTGQIGEMTAKLQ